MSKLNHKTFSFTIKVKKNHIDALNHVNNIQYINWVLKAAEKHWNFVTNKKFDDQYAWVVLRHEIDYFKSAKLNDDIVVKTWIRENYGVKSQRIVYVKNNNELLVKAKTIWVLLDKKKMKPVRIPEKICALFIKDKE